LSKRRAWIVYLSSYAYKPWIWFLFEWAAYKQMLRTKQVFIPLNQQIGWIYIVGYIPDAPTTGDGTCG